VHTRSQHPLSIAIEELREGKLEVGLRERAEESEENVGAADDFLNNAPEGSSSEGAA
jgi:DNA-directed RNA polymerase subunit omega